MAQQVSSGFINITEGQRAPTFRVPVRSTLGRLILRLSGDAVVTGALTLNPDSILRLIKRIELNIGGVRVASIGDGNPVSGAGVILYYQNAFWYGGVPQLSNPAVGIGTNPFSCTLQIPFEMPPELSNQYPQRNMGGGKGSMDLNARKMSMLSPTEKEIEINVDWGQASDMISAGVFTLSNTKLEVISLVYPSLDRIQMPFLLHHNSKQATLTPGATALESTEMDRVGIVPAIGILSLDNGIKSDAVYTDIDAVVNGNNHVYQMSWEAMRNNAKMQAGLASITEGNGLVLFDQEENGEGALILDANDVKAFQMKISHQGLTGVYRVILHVLSFQRQG